MRLCSAAAVLTAAASIFAQDSDAQGTAVLDSAALRPGALTLLNSEAVDRMRTGQLSNGVLTGQSLLLRSSSSLTPRLPRQVGGWSTAIISPQLLIVSNSSIPFSQNNGSLWAGRGVSTRTLLGARLESDRLRLILAPEIVLSANGNWLLRHPQFYAPPPPAGRTGSGFVFPYYIGPYSIDQPLRLGKNAIHRFDWGQSTASLTAGSIDFGISNESEWWGPGIRNAIVLSNNAPGFAHLFIRSSHPIATRFGAADFRWLVGGLSESRYFDTVSTNNLRSLASFAASLQTKWDPNLSVGLARSVFATSTGWGQVPLRWLDVFANTRHPARRPLADSSLTPGGKDDLYSLFARWVFPADGVELYTEWARTEFPTNLRDFLVAPNHSQGYTLGLQWLRGLRPGSKLRIQGELTNLEQSSTFRDRPVGSWYTSRRVIQGYTNQGEILGASIGPGASTQWLAADYLKIRWRLGAYVGRVRWNEDVHSTANFPQYVAYCIHDVSFYPGARVGSRTPIGDLSADISFQNRVNAFFQNGGGCPNNGARVDIRNTTLSVTLATFTHR